MEMTRDYIFFTRAALEHLVQTHHYQSSEYEVCVSLLGFLRGKQDSFTDSIVCSQNLSRGVIVYKDDFDRIGGLFWDLKQYKELLEEENSKLITILQKIFRSAVKYFGNQIFSPRELVRETNLIVFPMPSSYRVVLDRNSYRDGKTMNFLSLYFGGFTETTAPFDYSNLDRFYTEYKNSSATSKPKRESSDVSIPYTIEEISKHDQLITHLQFDDWREKLTDTQRSFVFSPLNGAKKLEGAAGTGKTLSLILKCIYHLKESDFKKRYAFITHSKATKENIISIFEQTFPEIKNHICTSERLDGSLLVTTIQEWSINYLGTNLSDTEYLDTDAFESKTMQLYYIENAYDIVMKNFYLSYKEIISDKLNTFVNTEDPEVKYELLQYEFGVVIKGRADEDFDTYDSLNRPQNVIPCDSREDRQFIFLIYQEYKKQFETQGLYDSDDIVLTALSSLNAPIWRRRRAKEGFDAVFIDEAQLFNFNELCVFQYLNKIECKNNIVFAMDKSQYAGEIFTDTEDCLAMSMDNNNLENTSSSMFSTVFRCCDDIVTFAYSIMSNGTSVFRNFDNPLEHILNGLTPNEEKKCFIPELYMLQNDEAIVDYTIKKCDSLVKDYAVSRGDVLIAVTNNELYSGFKKEFEKRNKPFAEVKRRGDALNVESARKNNKYVVAGMDYVGGLEFDYVIIAGVDESRVPPKRKKNEKNSFEFSNYAWHKRMYVAVTRAKYGVIIVGNTSYGLSPVLETAIRHKYLVQEND